MELEDFKHPYWCSLNIWLVELKKIGHFNINTGKILLFNALLSANKNLLIKNKS